MESLLDTSEASTNPLMLAHAAQQDRLVVAPSTESELIGVPDLSDVGYQCIRYMVNCVNGYVYLGRKRKGLRDFVAIKRFIADDANEYELISTEASNMRMLSHKNILELDNCFVYDNSIYLVTPAMHLGSMHDILGNYKTYGVNERAAAGIMHQLLNAVEYIHRKRYIHRDIRPQHILVDCDGNVKLSGFRFMIELDMRSDRVFDFDTHLRNQLYYFAPEVLAQNMHGYGTKSDIFMIGIVLCELLNGIVPFDESYPLEMLYRKLNRQVPRPVDANSLKDDAKRGLDISNRPEEHLTRVFSRELHSFVSMCLAFEPETRLSASELGDLQWTRNGVHTELLKELDLNPIDFDFDLWDQEPVLPKADEQKFENVFDFTT
ncbi:unnamed protein product [Caenorhabditis bovis]|uniref:Protein kinase domain-containing protein n=1 Tax=Caenorhabditis bovis TaxID=2654633 RepID=A0A8S1EHT2_9PELO|nr:unnamed protein product [Caenorhabditis bovis]